MTDSGPTSSSAITAASVVARADGQVSADLGDEILVLAVASGRYHRLERVAARAWELLEGAVRVAELRDALVEEYGVGADRCERDLVELLENLRERGLVEVRAAEGG